jgi:hypothetical protein
MYKQPGSDQVSGGGGIRRGRHVEARPAPAPAFFQTAPLHVALGSHGPFFQKQPILKKSQIEKSEFIKKNTKFEIMLTHQMQISK